VFHYFRVFRVSYVFLSYIFLLAKLAIGKYGTEKYAPVGIFEKD